jgi:ribonucleoside-triphosphate reductase
MEKQLRYIEDYKASSNAATGSKYDSNANVTEKNIATLAVELDKKAHIDLQRAVMDKYLKMMPNGEELAQYYIEDLNNHIIYRHDETTGAGGFPYCCAISLYPFLTDGLTKVGGNSLAPKHADSFIGSFINLLFIVAAQYAGAVACPETLTYFDHFLRKDYGDDYAENLDQIVELRAKGSVTLRERIENWFSQLVYTINQPAAARGNQSIFFNIAYFDKFYFESIFEDFFFPDGDQPCWESVKVLQKMFMEWLNNERLKSVITFPVETVNLLVRDNEYADIETADWVAEMWSKGASFFCYQSDSVDSLSSCCRLRNAVEHEAFSYTLGAGGIMTGSKAVITMNLNRIIQQWHKNKNGVPLSEHIAEITNRIHKYLEAFNNKIWDDYKANLLTIYKAEFIDLDKQYLTVGINGFVEAAEYLGIDVHPGNREYQQLAADTLGVIERLNREHRSEHIKYNLEFVPGESLGVKFARWDKEDGYEVPRDCYNSYFYRVEDDNDAAIKFYYQGKGFADVCSGGVALHNNLNEHLTKEQYRMLMNVAVDAGCNYFTYNIPNTICNECGHISKHMLYSCPKCGSEDLDYATRVIGYLKRISNFSEARQKEAAKRHYS